MITQEQAFKYALELQEFTKEGGRIEEICACQDRKQVVRRSFSLVENPPQPLTEEQIDTAIAQTEANKVELEAVKKKVIEEKAKIVVEDKEIVNNEENI